MKPQNRLLWVWAACALLFSCLLSSVSFAKGFLEQHFKDLQTAVFKTYSADFIAEKFSQRLSFSSWPFEVNDPLRLYVAVKWIEQGYHHEALSLLDSLRGRPVDPDLFRFYHATVLVNLGMAAKSAAEIDALVKKYPTDADILFLKSSYLVQTGDLLSAMGVLNDLIERHKKYGNAYLQRGLLKILAFSHDEALEDLMAADAYLPAHEVRKRQQAAFQAGLIYLKTFHDQAKAKSLFDKGISLDPESDLVARMREMAGL